MKKVFFYFFFFKQKTAYEITRRDWSSDVCSSDLLIEAKIVEVQLSSEKSFGIDWSVVSAAGSKYGFSISSSGGTASAATGVTQSLPGQLTFSMGTGGGTHVDAVLNALQ